MKVYAIREYYLMHDDRGTDLESGILLASVFSSWDKAQEELEKLCLNLNLSLHENETYFDLGEGYTQAKYEIDTINVR